MDGWEGLKVEIDIIIDTLFEDDTLGYKKEIIGGVSGLADTMQPLW